MMTLTVLPLSFQLHPTSPLLPNNPSVIPTRRRLTHQITKPNKNFVTSSIKLHSSLRKSSTPMKLLVSRAFQEGRESKHIEKPRYGCESQDVIVLGLIMAIVMLGSGESALAFGPEGPLVEEFWENMRRYGLYFITVGSGALYTILKPIFELLRNPITAVLVVVIVSGTFYLLSLVLSAMFGISDFAYQYAS